MTKEFDGAKTAYEDGQDRLAEETRRIAFFRWLVADCGYRNARPLFSGSDRWVAIQPLMYTNAIITGRIGDRCNVDDRWCYHDYESALAALERWDGEGEPEGWHRHPSSGRRRNGDGEEYVA